MKTQNNDGEIPDGWEVKKLVNLDGNIVRCLDCKLNDIFKLKENQITKITFEVADSNTYVSILRDGKQIGHIYSQKQESYKVGDEAGGLPYPHTNNEYCQNAIQICGFDKISEVWGCGLFHGKKDVVINFIPNNEYTDRKKAGYLNYVQNKIYKGDTDIQSFQDWNSHNI